MRRRRHTQVAVEIDGLRDFPLNVLGLTVESIEESDGNIIIPRELLPYIKICKMPTHIREQNLERMHRHVLKLRKRR